MKSNVLYIIAAFVVIEFTGNVLSLLSIEPTGFRLHLNTEWADDDNAYADRDSTVGVWHVPNDVWIQNGPCFTVEMQSNNYGARDNNWDTSQSGYVFLGSSFVEGYGVSYGNRLSEHFEELSKKEVFNCGMSGTFSPLQSFLVLKKFNKILKFDTCFVFLIIPGDEKLIIEEPDDRYRPYLDKTVIKYPDSDESKYKPKKELSKKAQLFFDQYFYTYHLYDFYRHRNTLKSEILDETENARQTKFPAINNVIKLFTKNYPEKYFVFVLLPTLSSENEEFNFQSAKNAHLVDLREALDAKSHYFTCNSHWNEIGHNKVANELYNSIYKKKDIN